MTPQEEIWFNELADEKRQDVKTFVKYPGIWKTIIDMYKESAHFVYELIQNADDALATEAKFELYDDRLVFKHNGKRKFNVSDPKKNDGKLGDLNSITSIGDSSKDKITGNTIGKFGIGFKSVFTYTETPEIYDRDVSFRLENKLIPVRLLDHPSDWSEEETWFVFPFNTPIKNPEAAVREIFQQLEQLHNPTLFLNNLQIISYKYAEKGGQYQKEIKEQKTFDSNTTASLISLHHDANGKVDEEEIWLFSRKSSDGLSYSVGFVLQDGELVPVSDYAYCYFQTKEETHLNFIIHAPFLLTPDRQHLKTESHNNQLIDLLANLAADSMLYLRDIGLDKNKLLITDEILNIVPIKEDDFLYKYNYLNEIKTAYYPFYEKILNKFQNEKILPAVNGYAFARNSYWAEDTELINVFSDDDLAKILNSESACWVFRSIPASQMKKDNHQRKWIVNVLFRQPFSEKFFKEYFLDGPQKYVESVFQNGNVEWFGKLFLWMNKSKERCEWAKSSAIFINTDGKAVPAYENGALKLFFPVEGSDYQFVHKIFCESETIKKFLQEIGITEPSRNEEVYSKILPRYANSAPDEEIVKSDFKKIFDYFKVCPNSEINDFIKKIKDSLLFRCKSQDGSTGYAKINEVYLDNPDLRIWFEGNDNVKFLDLNFYNELNPGSSVFFEKLQIFNEPKLVYAEIDVDEQIRKGYSVWSEIRVKIGEYLDKKYKSNRKNSTPSFIKISEFQLDGFDCKKLNSVSENYSKILFKHLLKNGFKFFSLTNLNFSFHSQGIYKKELKIDSIEGCPLCWMLRLSSWLYLKDGTTKQTNTIYIEDLADFYDLQSKEARDFLEILDIKPRPKIDLATLDSETKKAIEFVEKIKKLGFDVSEKTLDELRKLQESKNRPLLSQNSGTKIVSCSTVTGISPNPTSYASENDDEHSIKSKVARDILKKVGELKQAASAPILNTPFENVDFDDYSPKSIDFGKKIERAKNRSACEINAIERLDELQNIAANSEKYSFVWFKALLEMEASASFENNSGNRQVNITFTKVEKTNNGHLILKHPNHYIPQHIEDLANIPVDLEKADGSKIHVVFEAMSVKSFDLHVKLLNPEEIAKENLDDVTNVNINAQSPAFLYQELLKKFKGLKNSDDVILADTFNMKDNLTERIKFVFGPPGTGKTTHLAKNVLIPFMEQEKKILVLAPTNKAVNVLVARIAEQFSDSDESYKQWLFRFGVSGDEKVEEYGIHQGKEFDIENVKKAVVVTTIARFPYDNFIQGKSLDELPWDAIVIDEASMIPLANIVYPLYKSKTDFVIAGDPFQIEPITSVDMWKDQNIYKMVGLCDFKNPKTEPHDYDVVKLETQYRSVPAIGSIYSNLFYGGMLKHYRTENSQRKLNLDDFDLRALNIIKFPVQKYEGIYKCKKLNNSHYQIYSALFTYEYICHLAKRISEKNPDETFTIGVIAAYRPQASMVDRLFASANLPSNVKVQAGTIHGFQGDECDIIVVLFNPPENILANGNIFLNKRNIINVAISRAKDYLFIVMPDDNTEKIENLQLIKHLENMVRQQGCAEFNSKDLEQEIFGESEYLEKSVFLTTHQNVNVYGEPQYRYEIRSEEEAIDIQILKNEDFTRSSS